ncbi:MAG: penicillin-binding protein, partial [Bacteroidota bacterium]|nr:penicillin-binding protein [Bacteroidota bacterium]
MNKSKKIIKKLWLLLISGGLFLLVFIISVNYNFYNLFGGMPSLQDLEKPESELSSELYSSDNKLLGKYFRYNRSPVKFDELS